MHRFVLVLTVLAVPLLPARGLAADFTIQLPFNYWGMASCGTPPGEDVTVSCDLDQNDRQGVDISCDIVGTQPSGDREIALDMSIWRTGDSSPAKMPTPGKKLSYSYSGIGCWANVPASVLDMQCKMGRDGFGCSWCDRVSCYEGKASLGPKRTRQAKAAADMAVSTSLDKEDRETAFDHR